MQADLLKAQENISQSQQALTLANADKEKVETKLTDYQAGEVGRLRAYRRAYVTSVRIVPEVLINASEVQPLPLSDMEIMRHGRVILQRRALPHSSSTSIGGAAPANPPPRPARRGSSGVRPAPLARPTRPRTARPPRSASPARLRAAHPPRPATPVRPRAPRTARPTTPTPLQSVSPARATYIPGLGLGERRLGLGGRSGNVSFASPIFREASQAARQAHSTNDRLNHDAPSPSRRRARSPSDDFDSDGQPLAQRRQCRAPRPMSDSGPSSIPSPPPAAVASPPPPIVTPPPILNPVNDPPTPSGIQVEPPLAQPYASQQP
ncbi:protein transport protein sec31-like [Zingiber officinale]|uniref:protein transport protein sec31-like n=1 Tax=Zingiber officinale TaxID=94328 RepID=UPI001C4B19EA|nr:protein transport protein sec31-like [Zingiber officinale]